MALLCAIRHLTPRLAMLVVLMSLLCALVDSKQPNILFILTDDQDVLLGSMQAMPQTKKLLGEGGVMMEQAFATTPVCCPSRSSFLTGKLIHNSGVFNNSAQGGCSSLSWQAGNEKQSVGALLQNGGYRTAYMGKYMNDYGSPNVGGLRHVPPGWDDWVGLKGNSIYYNYNLSVNGVTEVHGHVYETDYLPELLTNRSSAWLQNHTLSNALENEDKPFFLFLSMPSSHQPADPAPQYADAFPGAHAPRTATWNVQYEDRHWFVRESGVLGPMNASVTAFSDLLYRRRLQTLLTVDDTIARLVTELEDSGELNNTYIFFTSDHGYHLGQFGLALDKRLPYEVDLRVPFYARGPSFPPNVNVSAAFALNIDVVPTFLELAGLTTPVDIDGQSLVPFLTGKSKREGDFLVEYYGEDDGARNNSVCSVMHGKEGMTCFINGNTTTPPYYFFPNFCNCQDSTNNTYHCVRTLSSSENTDFRQCIQHWNEDTAPLMRETVKSYSVICLCMLSLLSHVLIIAVFE